MLFRKSKSADLLNSSLFDQNNFFKALELDLKHATKSVLIESPFITERRMSRLLPILERLVERGVKIIVNTKPLHEHDLSFVEQAEDAIHQMQDLGVIVLMTVGHHRKIAIIDERILWEGSLNILSQNDSCEFMRRINSIELADQMMKFLKLGHYLY